MTTLGFLGDLHGSADTLRAQTQRAADAGCAAVVQVGDLGWYPQFERDFCTVPLTLPVFWCGGNHEDWSNLRRYTQPTAIRRDNLLTFVPNGGAVDIAGRLIFFMGGGDSVDKAVNHRWQAEEVPTPEHWARLLSHPVPCDTLVSHSPGQHLIDKHFSRRNLAIWGLPAAWTSPVAVMLDYARTWLGNPRTVSGHMHRTIQYEDQIVLDIGELRIL
jgi:hypothetical protein